MNRFTAVLGSVAVAVLTVGCGRSEHADSAARQYQVRGFVRGFSVDRRTIEIEHETIPDFMPSMSMSFPTRDPKELLDLHKGDAISFRLDASRARATVGDVKKIPAADVHLPNGADGATPPALP
jgi:Cu/Ag efflux protein CusF